MSRLRLVLRAFGHFWWDFLIGDAPEFVVATGIIIALAYGLHHRTVAATIALPLVAAGFLLASTYRGRQRPQSTGPAAAESTPTPPVPPPPAS